MSKLKLPEDFSQNRVKDLEIRKSVPTARPKRFEAPFWLRVLNNAVISGGIGIGCAWLALYSLGRM